MRKTGREKRNIILFAVAVVGLAALIVMALVRRPVMIMPPEPAEIVEKRQAPDNAFFTLQEAVALLPKTKPRLVSVPDKEYPEHKVRYEPEPHSMGALLEIYRPDDDPQLIEYVDKLAPAVAKVRDTFSKSYYLYPEIGTRENSMVYLPKYTRLGKVLIAYGLRMWQIDGLDENVLSCLIDSVRLGRMVANDGGVIHFEFGTSVQSAALNALSAHVSEHDDESMLRKVLQEVRHFASVPQPLEPHLEFGWRMMDNAARRPPSDDPAYRGRRPFVLRIVENAFRGWLAKRVRRFIRDNRDLLLEGCPLSYEDFLTWIDGQRRTDKIAVYEALAPIQSLVYYRVLCTTRYNGTQLALALELYRNDHGTYPEALDELVPTFFDALPADPYSDKPFIYRPADGEYWLYGVGQNFRDDDGHTNRDMLIRRPKVELQPQPQPPVAGRTQPRDPAARRPSMRRGRPAGRMRGRPGRRIQRQGETS